MATKEKKPAAKRSSTTVTRITAQTETTVPPSRTAAPKAAKPATQSRPLWRRLLSPFIALGTYFKGSWYELRQVRWPDRKATWGLTAALVAFTGFFVVVILLLDALFKYLFQLILG